MGGGAGSGGGAKVHPPARSARPYVDYHVQGPVDRVYHFSDDAYDAYDQSLQSKQYDRKRPAKRKYKKGGSRSRSGSGDSFNYDSGSIGKSGSRECKEVRAAPPRQLPPPPGLKNVGNSCYANAALQCLLSTALPHALLDERNAHIIRRHSFNRKLLVCGSGSVDSEDEEGKDEDFGSCLSGMSGFSGYSEVCDDDEVIVARGLDEPYGSPRVRKMVGSKSANRRRHQDDGTICSNSTMHSNLYQALEKRRDQQPTEADLLCAWLTQELAQITREYTTPPQGFEEKRRLNTPQAAGCSAGILGSVLSMGSKSSKRSQENRVVDPGSITRHVHKISPTLRPYQQEDAHEFFRSLLSSLTMHGQNARLSSLFDGLLESSVTCQTCKKTSLTRDRYMDLSLDIADRDITTLERALAKFTEEETLDGDNMVTCSRCSVKRVVTKGLRLATAPTMLVINYKRFAYDNYGRLVRLSKPVEFPLRLELRDYMSRANRGKPPPYTLVAVLVHRGRSCDCGHYFAYVKKGQDWYLTNDAVVTKVNEEEVLSAQAYVLVYEVEGMKERHGFDCYSRYHKSTKGDDAASNRKKKDNSLSPWDFSTFSSILEACDVGLCGSTANVRDESYTNPAYSDSEDKRGQSSHSFGDTDNKKKKKGKSPKPKHKKILDDMDAKDRERDEHAYYKRGRSHTPSRSTRNREKEIPDETSMFDFEPPSHRRAKSLSRVEMLKTREDAIDRNAKRTRRRSRSRDGSRQEAGKVGSLPPLH